MYEISLTTGNIRIVETNEIFIPDDRNPKWILFLQYQKNGGIVETVDIFQEEIYNYNRQFFPKIVSQRQLRTQLVLNGFNLNDIQTAISALTEPNKSIAQIAWDYAITFERDSPLLISLGESLGLSQTDIDNIFINASKL